MVFTIDKIDFLRSLTFFYGSVVLNLGYGPTLKFNKSKI